MISEYDQCLFVHIPKVAGQSIEQVFLTRAGHTWQQREKFLLKANHEPALGPPRLAHLTASEYVSKGHIQQKEFEELFRFSFVRNPWDRLVSEYLYRGHTFSFKDWLFNYFPTAHNDDYQKSYDAYRHIMPQYDFLYDQRGNLLVDYVGRFENLSEDFAKVSELITGQRLSLPHKNKTPIAGLKSKVRAIVMPSRKLDYQAYYDDESRDFVEGFYAKDIKHFAYQFD
jgi:hypothetical protein